MSAGQIAELNTALARYGGLMPVWEQARATEPEQRTQREEFLQTLSDSMPEYLARWPKKSHKEARLRIVLFSVQLDAFFLYSPPSDMDVADRALAGRSPDIDGGLPARPTASAYARISR